MTRFSIFVLLLLPVAVVSCSSQPKEQQPENPQAENVQREKREPVNLLAMGDWGAGGVAQKETAQTLANHVSQSQRDFSALLTLGDNFYAKLTGIDDPRWRTMFEEMYHAEKLNFPFFIALGNHDYSNNLVKMERQYAREHPTSRWKFPAKWYRLDFPKDDPFVSVLMLDSNQQHLSGEEWLDELKWMKKELSKRRTGWMICCAHHPLFSNGDHGDNGVLQREWGALFKQYNVDFFLAGHDHDVQHLEIPGWRTSFVLAGGGGAGTRPMRNDRRGPFSKSSNGFADLQIDANRALVKIISRSGEVLHAFERTREGKVTVLKNVPSDVAIPRTPKSITRGGEESTTKASTKPTTKPATTRKAD